MAEGSLRVVRGDAARASASLETLESSRASRLNAAASASLGRQLGEVVVSQGQLGRKRKRSVRLEGIGGTEARLREKSNLAAVLQAAHKPCEMCPQHTSEIALLQARI